MANLIPFLCLILLARHATGASSSVWSVDYGERTATPVQTFAASDGNGGAVNQVEHFYQNFDLQQQPQPQFNVDQLFNPQAQVQVPEHKSGTKGGFLGLFKSKQRQQPLLVVPFPEGYDQPFANSGYMEPLSASQVSNASTKFAAKQRPRDHFPWNWVFPPSTQAVGETILPAQPKRSWSFLPQFIRPNSAPKPLRTGPQCQCWSQPTYQYPLQLPAQFDSSSLYPQLPNVVATYPQQSSQEQVPSVGSTNVRPVNPSDDFRGLESNPSPSFVQPSQSQSSNVLQSLALTQQGTVQQQHQQPMSVPALGSTGAATEQTSTQQVAPQQGSLSFPSHTFPTKANAPSLPPSTSYQSPAGEAAQSRGQAANI